MNTNNLAHRFRQHADSWHRDTAHLSNTMQAALHPGHLKIIGMGEPALPLILREMRDRGGHWFLALESIAGENPILDEHCGYVPLMKEDWLQWGRERGYL